MMPPLTAMDYIRAALANAAASGLDLGDVIAMAEHAETPEAFDAAVDMLGETEPRGAVWVAGEWVAIE